MEKLLQLLKENARASSEQLAVMLNCTKEEVEKAENCGFQAVSLGKSRLRTETAALVAVHIMNMINS